MGTGYKLQFTEYRLPPTANVYKRMHWAVIAKEKKYWVELISKMKAPDKPLEKYTLKLTRRSSAIPDYDGVVLSFKIVVDALRVCGIIKDDRYDMTGIWVVRWEKCPPKKGNITVKVIETENQRG